MFKACLSHISITQPFPEKQTHSLSPTSPVEKDKTFKRQFPSAIFTTQSLSRRFSGKQTKSRNILREVEFSWLHHHCRHRATPSRGHVMTSAVQRPCVIIIPGNWAIPPSYVLCSPLKRTQSEAGSLLTSCFKTLLVKGPRNCESALSLFLETG